MIYYPDTLPCPTSNYRGKGGPNFLRTEFDFSIRQRTIPGYKRSIDLEFILPTAEDMVAFKDFYYTTLNKGAYTFSAKWDVDGDLTMKEFRFIDHYSTSSLIGTAYRVTASFDVLTEI